MLAKLSNYFLLLVIGFLMLLSSAITKAQDASTKCEWQWKWVDEQVVVNGGITTEKKYKYVYECVPNDKNKDSTKPNEQNTPVAKSQVEESKFSVSRDNPIIGTWKYSEYGTTELPEIVNGTVVMKKSRYLTGKTMTFIFSQNGVVEIIQNQGLMELGKGKFNWRYVSATKTKGNLEIFLGEKIITKGDVSFLDKNRLEIIGTPDIWIRE